MQRNGIKLNESFDLIGDKNLIHTLVWEKLNQIRDQIPGFENKVLFWTDNKNESATITIYAGSIPELGELSSTIFRLIDDFTLTEATEIIERRFIKDDSHLPERKGVFMDFKKKFVETFRLMLGEKVEREIGETLGIGPGRIH